MKSWLRFFGLSFFSDKIAKEARIRGVLNCVLGLVLALLFIFLGVLSANTVPFYSHYGNADDFKEFVRLALAESELSLDGGRLSSEAVVDTFASETDAARFAANGYNLVIDTRPAEAFDDFDAYCTPKGEGEKISYEEYLALPEEARADYDFKIEYTPRERVLTAEFISECEAFLAASEDAEISATYAEISQNKSAEGYEAALYALYLQAYYPAFTAYERDGVPLLRNYYYVNYLNKSDTEKCLFIFDDVTFGYFTTGGGVKVEFYGLYDKLAEGDLTADGADDFITKAFSASVPVSTNVYLFNIFRFIPIIALMSVLLALIAKIALTLFKDEKYKKYTTCLKIEFSYLFVGSVLTALIIFICGFFTSSTALNNLPLIVFAAVLAVRTAVLLIGEYIIVKKSDDGGH